MVEGGPEQRIALLYKAKQVLTPVSRRVGLGPISLCIVIVIAE
jgi:hypothetical protein